MNVLATTSIIRHLIWRITPTSLETAADKTKERVFVHSKPEKNRYNNH